MKTKSVQDGVLFYLNENNYIVDVKMKSPPLCGAWLL